MYLAVLSLSYSTRDLSLQRLDSSCNWWAQYVRGIRVLVTPPGWKLRPLHCREDS